MASDPEKPEQRGASASFPCSACDMVFPSRTLRESHAYRFCIGPLTPGGPRGRRKSPAGPSASLPLGREGQSHHPEDQLETPRKTPGQGEASGASLKRLTEEVQRLRMSLQEMASLQKGTAGSRAHLEETHARRLAEIGARTQRLEKHREEIRQQLGGLAGGDAGTSILGQVMLVIQAQEKRTQLALDTLGERVEKLQARTQPDLPAAVKEEEEGSSLSLLALPASQGVLTSEIRALQMSYLQSGGKDPGVLAKIWELYLEAALLEGGTQKKQGKASVGPRKPDTRSQALEAINGHLEAEILALQMQRGPRRARQGLWEPHAKEGIGLLRRGRGGSARLPPPVAPPLPPPPPGPSRDTPFLGMMETIEAPAQSRHLLPPPDVLGPAPYDPGAGFAIFYDFLLGLEPGWSQVQLVTGLARGGQETGPSTALPPSPCLPLPPTPGAPLGNCAILAARQPVPRLPPSLAVTLITELQAWGLWDGGQEPRPQAWTSVQLFDMEQRVLSGRWRLPLRALPRVPGLSSRQLNAIPQAGQIELYLRIANARDAEIQVLARIDPVQGQKYSYLPAVSNSASLEDSNLYSHFLGPPSLLPSLSLSDGFHDPPPAPE
ncbi:coiled-coil domain-containing protein 17 [Dromiciops gliroides]|uniref:coiled-coil domain-containing protein 17 n=1 Tax=Dromiciops gliroides TaxID=33562 RepID=UPI001CC4E7EB|nr:coiled-coil domain-containing protein 17 [Dromiciops gliroides]